MGELTAIGLALDLWQNAYNQRLRRSGSVGNNVAPSLPSPKPVDGGTAIDIKGTIPSSEEGMTSTTSSHVNAARVSILQRAPLRILTDSQYCIGVLTMQWKVIENVELIERLKSRIKEVKLILGNGSRVSLH
jgi:hypothetical protein